MLKTKLSEGQSYAATTSEVLSSLTGISKDILKAPNTILGIEYLKANLNLKKPLTANIIQRIKTEHNDLNYSTKFC